MAFKKGDPKAKHGGRKKGIPNKHTQDIRDAFRRLIESNIPNFSKWIDAVAQGEKTKYMTRDVSGKDVILERWLREPNPAKAMELIKDMAEFHIPKLARTELTGEGGGAIMIQSTPTDEAL